MVIDFAEQEMTVMNREQAIRKALVIRNNNLVFHVETEKLEDFPSINAAKRKVRELGKLTVVDSGGEKLISTRQKQLEKDKEKVA